MVKFLLICIGVLSISSSYANETESYKTNLNSGTKLSNPILPILNLHGSYHEMGEQYGALMKSELQQLHQKVVPNYYKWYTWTGLKSIVIAGYYNFKIDQREKDILTGISSTSGLSYFQTLQVAVLPIVMLLNGVVSSMDSTTPDLGNCSFAAVWGSQSANKSMLIARNLDLFKQVKPLDEYSILTVFHPNNGDNKLAIFSFVGFIPGFTWVSERGIFVEYNNGQRSVAGINPLGFLNLNLNFYGLLAAHNVAAFKNYLLANKTVMSNIIGIADTASSVRVENPVSQTPLFLEGQLATANYFSNLFTTNFPKSKLTTQNCTDLLNDTPTYACLRYHILQNYFNKNKNISLDNLKKLMVTPIAENGLYQSGSSIKYPVDEITVQTIIGDVANQSYYFHRFPQKQNEWSQINLQELFNN